MISGDIRFEWEFLNEKNRGERMRGKGAQKSLQWFNGERIPDQQFDVEFNLMFDYRGQCTWAVAHLEFDNNAGLDQSPFGCSGRFREGTDPATGIYGSTNSDGDPSGCHGSGTCENLCLRKAYFGWNIFEECNSRLDIEVGRRHLYDVFESRVQFRSRMDGALLRYSNCFECVGDFYVNLGAWVVDENANHWAWGVEVGLLDIADYGIDVKYSFVDWTKDSTNRCNVSDPVGFQFQVSQFYLAYNFNPELLCTSARIYTAFLINHDAEKRSYLNNKKENLGWYIGFSVGEVCCEGDWWFDINYQYVEAEAIPDWDLTGIGRGNVRGIPLTQNARFGWTNYQGFRAEALYAITDNLALNPSFELSSEARKDVTTPITKTEYTKVELQVIYAF
ncbi:Uncharacterized protein SCG7086_AX_00020 [Chlamydiales bacterium SCGC AG-110-P3]|nr:Uncharacterized protein SCG7086_AX_00020 [Chlamydiales bacterium SCGC AG-110-P3]